MKILPKILLGAASLLGMATAVYADDAPPAPDFSLTGALAVQSDYRYRGISQNDKEIAPQGTLNLSAPEGFYAGTWLSKVDWGGGNPGFEMDLYAGKHTDIGGSDLNIEAYYYSYPDAVFPGTKASYYETIVQLSHVFGPLTLTATGANSPEWSLSGGTGWYAEGTAAYAATDWLTISGNFGHQWVQLAPSDYSHYDIGATAVYKSLSLDVRFIANDITKAACAGYWMATKSACGSTVVGTLTWNVSLLP